MTSPEIIGYDEFVSAGDDYAYVGDGYEGVVSGVDEIGIDVGADDDLRHLLAISGADDYVGYDPEIGYETDIGAAIDEARRRRARQAAAPRQIVRPRQAVVRPRQATASPGSAPLVARPAGGPSIVRATQRVPQAAQAAPHPSERLGMRKSVDARKRWGLLWAA